MNLFGNRDRFAIGFELVTDPDTGGIPQDRASWGNLQLWVAGRNLTSARTESGNLVDCAEVPLAPILQWFLDHWDPLLHEERLPTLISAESSAAWTTDVLETLPSSDDEMLRVMSVRQEWQDRHSLGSSLPGFRIPDVHFRRASDEMELSWNEAEWRSVPRGVRLLEPEGAVSLSVDLVARALYDWSDSLTNALADRKDCGEFSRSARKRLIQLTSPDAALDRLRWGAGQGIDAAAKTLLRRLRVVGSSVEDTIRALLGVDSSSGGGLFTRFTLPVLLFRSARPQLSQRDLLQLLELTEDGNAPSQNFMRYQVPSPAPRRPLAATQDGYEKAMQVRNLLGIPNEDALTGEWDLEHRVLRRVGIEVCDIKLDDDETEGVAVAAPAQAPRIAVNLRGRKSSTAWGRRMTLAHELCHLLHDVDDRGLVGVTSNPWAPNPIERRANAFAAMLLAPREALSIHLHEDASQWDRRNLEDAMKSLGIGRQTLMWQLYNLHWISESERDFWLDSL